MKLFTMDYTIHILYILIVFYRSKVVSQFCGPDKERIICKYNFCVLRCRPRNLIQIISASYGRTTRNLCPKVMNVQYGYGLTCSASTAMQVISTACTNKRMCVFEASNDFFGNHCFSNNKYIKVHYRCTEEPQTTSSSSQMTEKTISSTSKMTDKPQTPSTSKMIGVMVIVVVLSVIVFTMFICVFVLLYKRVILRRRDPGTIINSIVNRKSPARDATLSVLTNLQLTHSVSNQYSEISLSTPQAGAYAEFSSCIPVPDYSCQSSTPGNSMDYHEVDCVDDVAANQSNLGFKSNVNDGAYFILDPKETRVNQSKELQREISTKLASNETKCELAQSMDQTNLQENLNDCITGKYGDSCKYNPVLKLNINQTKRQREDLSDRVVDDVYDVSSYKKGYEG